MNTKSCTECKVEKLTTEFYIIKGQLCRYCIKCKKRKDAFYYYKRGGRERIKKARAEFLEIHRQRDRLYRLSNPDRAKGKLLQKYWPGTTWKEALNNFRTLVQVQNNLCKICNKPETCTYKKSPSIGKIRDLCVDHCHKTNKVRGLLCDYCNTLIARARDNPQICESAALYLREAA